MSVLIPADRVTTWVFDALNKLTARQRAAVVLTQVWGLSVREAAEVMGCRETTTKTHLTRGMAHLRERGARESTIKEATRAI